MKQLFKRLGRKGLDKGEKNKRKLSDMIRHGVSVFLTLSVLVSTSYAEGRSQPTIGGSGRSEKNVHEERSNDYEFEYYTTVTKRVAGPDTSYVSTKEWVYAYGDDTEPLEPAEVGSDTFVIPDELVDDCLGMKYYVVNYEYVKMDYDDIVASRDTASTTMFDIYADQPVYEDWYLENIFYLSPEYDTIATLRAFVSCLDEDGWPRAKYFGFAYPDEGGFSWSIVYGRFQRRPLEEIDETILKESRIKVYPNPTSGMLFVDVGRETRTVVVYDVTGRRVFDVRGNGLLAFDISTLNSGTYWLVVETEGKKEVKKVEVITDFPER